MINEIDPTGVAFQRVSLVIKFVWTKIITFVSAMANFFVSIRRNLAESPTFVLNREDIAKYLIPAKKRILFVS